MKRKVVVEVDLCDRCSKDAKYGLTCLHCGQILCPKCAHEYMMEYRQGLACNGSYDGFYCANCDLQLRREEKRDLLHAAYLNMNAIREERVRVLEEIDRRADVIEREIRSLFELRKRIVKGEEKRPEVLEEFGIVEEKDKERLKPLDIQYCTLEEIQNILLLVNKDVPLDVIDTWTNEEREQVIDWASAVHLRASDNDDVRVPKYPEVLNRYFQGILFFPRLDDNE